MNNDLVDRQLATKVRHAYYVEVEVCEKDDSIIEGKCAGYVAAWAAYRGEAFPHVLFVPTNPRDVPVIRAVITSLPEADRPLFKLAVADEVIETILGNRPAAQDPGPDTEGAAGIFTVWSKAT